MQRLVAMTLVSSVLGTVSALGQPMLISPYSAPPPQPQYYPPQVIVAQPAYAYPERPNLGGGFIEFLFGGGGGARQPAPAYQPQPVPQPAPQMMQPLPQAPPLPPVQAMGPGYVPVPAPVLRPVIQGPPGRPAIDPRYMRQTVDYDGDEKPGTIIINTPQRLLYLVEPDGKAVRYGIGVGRPGFTWAGVHQVTAKREWPDWYPPEEMLKRRPDLPHYMHGGEDNPLGARAMYLGSTLYRIHGSNEPWTIGTQVSSGCIRMRNEDVIDLYERVPVGTKVVVI
jgi:lipoprotein-anchoring transpeptidase ErfK/SrfK